MTDLPSSAPAGSPPENAACSHGIEGLCFACLPVRRCSFHERTNALNAAIRAAHKSGASPDSIAALAQIRDRLYDYRQDGHEKTALKNRIRNYRRAIKQLQKAYDLRESLIAISISRAARRHDERLNGARESQELRSQLSALREENERLKQQIAILEAPDICGRNEDTFYEQDDFDGLAEIPNEIVGIEWANRVLYGEWRAVNLVTAWDEDGDMEECEIRLFRSDADARAAVAESLAKRAAISSPPLDRERSNE